jgi:signal transduction histidine kinase
LSNVGRHAGAEHASVQLAIIDDAARLTVTDDGRGFDPAAPRSQDHQGLSNMRDRAFALGGELTIESAPGHGTRVVVVVPRADAEGAGL